MQLLLSTSRRFHNWWVGAFVRYQSLDGAVVRDSPLVRQRYALAGGFGVAWIFARSGTAGGCLMNRNPFVSAVRLGARGRGPGRRRSKGSEI